MVATALLSSVMLKSGIGLALLAIGSWLGIGMLSRVKSAPCSHCGAVEGSNATNCDACQEYQEAGTW